MLRILEQCSEISRTFHYKCSSFSGAFHSWWVVPGTGKVYLVQPWLEQNLIERPNAVSLVFTFGVNWCLILIGRGFEIFNREDQCSIVRFTSLFEAILDRSSSRYRMVNITEIKKYVLISTSQSLPLDKADSYKLTLTLIIDRS